MEFGESYPLWRVLPPRFVSPNCIKSYEGSQMCEICLKIAGFALFCAVLRAKWGKSGLMRERRCIDKIRNYGALILLMCGYY